MSRESGHEAMAITEKDSEREEKHMRGERW